MTDEELIERLLGGCSCNMETSPCMAEDDCRLDMEAARRICALRLFPPVVVAALIPACLRSAAS